MAVHQSFLHAADSFVCKNQRIRYSMCYIDNNKHAGHRHSKAFPIVAVPLASNSFIRRRFQPIEILENMVRFT